MKKIFFFSFLFLSLNGYSQSTEEEAVKLMEASAQDDNYLSFIDELVKFHSSNENVYEKYYSNEFLEKISSVENNREVCSLSDIEFKKWINSNLSKTKFSSNEEALKLFSNFNRYSKLNYERHKQNSLKLEEYKQKYGLLLHQQVLDIIAYSELNAHKKLFSKKNDLVLIN